MSEEYQPVKYRIEIYEDSFVNDPTVVLHATEPFLSIHAGDYIADRCWEVATNSDMQGKVMRVKAVQHIIWSIKDSHVGHSLSVCVEAVPKPDEIF